jgi:GNAT superfamily N-acetyltransferase
MENGHDPTPLQIVPMTIIHLPAVRLLYALLIDEKQPPYPIIDAEELDNFTRCLAQCLLHPEQPERFPGWVAVIDSTVVGFLFGERETRIVGKPKDIWVAHWMVVRPGYRDHGIGKAMVRAGIAWLRERGVPLVELAAFAGDEQWKARGWTPILTRYVATVETIDAAVSAPVHQPAMETVPAESEEA